MTSFWRCPGREKPRNWPVSSPTERRSLTTFDFQRFHPGGKLGAHLLKAQDVVHRGTNLPVVPATVALSEAIIEKAVKCFGITGIVDEAGILAGVLTDGDLRRAFRRGFVNGPVTDVMGRHPRSIGPAPLAVEVMAFMNESRITSVFVVEDQKPIGQIHLHDLLAIGVV